MASFGGSRIVAANFLAGPRLVASHDCDAARADVGDGFQYMPAGYSRRLLSIYVRLTVLSNLDRHVTDVVCRLGRRGGNLVDRGVSWGKLSDTGKYYVGSCLRNGRSLCKASSAATTAVSVQ